MKDEEAIEIALDRFSTLRTEGALKSIKDIADRTGRDSAQVSRAITKAFKLGLVEVRRVETTRPNRVGSLEEDLLRRFHGLRQALVVQSDRTKASDEKAHNDEVHYLLGRTLGEHLAAGAGSIFRDGDVVGMGGGRAVYHTVDTLRQMSPCRASNITLMSLAGAVYARDRSGKTNLVYDADFHVPILGSFFAERVTLNLISHPIAYKSAKAMNDVRSLTCLSDQNWRQKPPTIALTGAGGLLAHGSGLCDKRNRLSSAAFVVEPILAPLSKLNTLCESVARPSRVDYSPVADICNQFFYVPPPEGVEIRKSLEDKIGELVAELNSMLLSANEEQLQQIQSIYLIAGTKEKACTIHELIQGGRFPNIHVLCTDIEAAQAILNMS